MTHMDQNEAEEQLSPESPSRSREKEAGFIIPNQLVLKKLFFGKKEILLLGVREGFEEHSLFVKKICESLKITSVVTGIPPDMPYFIRTEDLSLIHI